MECRGVKVGKVCRHSRDMLMYHRSLAFRKEPHQAFRPPQHCQHTPLPDTPGMGQRQDCDAYEADSFIASEEGTMNEGSSRFLDFISSGPTPLSQTTPDLCTFVNI